MGYAVRLPTRSFYSTYELHDKKTSCCNRITSRVSPNRYTSYFKSACMRFGAEIRQILQSSMLHERFVQCLFTGQVRSVCAEKDGINCLSFSLKVALSPISADHMLWQKSAAILPGCSLCNKIVRPSSRSRNSCQISWCFGPPSAVPAPLFAVFRSCRATAQILTLSSVLSTLFSVLPAVLSSRFRSRRARQRR